MSIERYKDFREGAVAVTQKSDYLLSLEEHIRQNRGELKGHIIEGLQAGHHDENSEEAKKEERERLKRQKLFIDIDIANNGWMDRIAADAKSTINWLGKQQRINWQEHIEAGKNVTVPPKEVLIINGRVATREQIEAFSAKNGGCYAYTAREELVLDAYGEPLTDASGFNYFNQDAQDRMTQALDTAQEYADIIEKIDAGAMSFADLAEDKKIAFLAAQPQAVREKMYKSAGLNADEIAQSEERIAALPKTGGVLAELERAPTYEKPEVSVTFSGPALSQSFGSAAFLKPVELQPLKPVLTLGAPAPAPST